MRVPASYPLHPSGEQVQAYLERYAQLHGLDRGGRLRFETVVVHVKRTTKGWEIQVSMIWYLPGLARLIR